MSIATALTNLTNTIRGIASTKQDIKSAVNYDIETIVNEQIEAYPELIRANQEALKQYIPTIKSEGKQLNLSTIPLKSKEFAMIGDIFQQTYEGKNLYNDNDEVTRYYITNTGATVLGSNGDTFIETLIENDIASNYVISFTEKVSTPSIRFSFFNGDAFISRTVLSSSEDTVEVPANTTKIYIHTDKRDSKYFKELQIEDGSIATDYEPFVGVTASPNPDYLQEIRVVKGNQIVYKNRLPAGYKELDYIESDGNSYIDTGIVSGPNVSTKVKHLVSDLSLERNYILGAYTGTGNSSKNRYQFSYVSGGKYIFGFGGETSQATIQLQGSIHDLSIENGTLKIDDNVIVSISSSDFNANAVSIALFAVQSGSGVERQARGVRVYSAKIENNNILVREFIPCINPQNEVGLYDLVTNTFFANQGTGSFIAGNVIGALPLNLRSRNVYNKDGEVTDYFINNSGNQETASGRKFIKNIITENIAEKYTISFKSKKSNESVRFCFYNGDTFLSRTLLYNSGDTVTVPVNTTKIDIRPDANYGNYGFTDLQIEEGENVSEYQEYYDYELAKLNDNADVIFKNEASSKYYNSNLDNNAWYIKKNIVKVILDGTESWLFTNGIMYFRPTNYLKENSTICKCSHFTGQDNVTATSNINNNSCCFRIGDTVNACYFKDTDIFTSLSAGTAFFAQKYADGDPVILYYVLATPTYTKITDTELISQLEAIENEKMLDGTTIIYAENGEGLQPTLYVEAYTKVGEE